MQEEEKKEPEASSKLVKLEIIDPKLFITKRTEFFNFSIVATGNQRNVLNAILTKVKVNTPVDDETEYWVEFQLKEVCQLLGINGHDYKQWKEVLTSMKQISFKGITSEKEKDVMLLAESELIYSGMGARFKLSPLAKRFFVRMVDEKNNIVPYVKQLFKSSIWPNVYTHVIWDMLSVVKNQKHKHVEIKLDEFRANCDMPTDLYLDFYDFNRRVLAPAKNLINTTTGMKMDYTPLVVGRKVVAIRFFIISISSSEIFEPKEILSVEYRLNTPEEAEKIKGSLIKENFNFTEDEIEAISKEYPIERYKVFYSMYYSKGELFADPEKLPEKELLAALAIVRGIRTEAAKPKYAKRPKTEVRKKPIVKKKK